MDLKHKNIKVCEWAKKIKTECEALADIIVPDTQPDIYRVLCVNATCNLDERYIRKDKIIFSGTVKFTVLYTGENQRDTIYTIEHTAPFNHQAEMPQAPEDALCISRCVVSSTGFTVKNSRKIAACAFLLLDTNATKHKEINALEALQGDGIVPHKFTEINSDSSICSKEVEFVLSDTISVPMAEDSRILDFNVRIDEAEIKTVNNKAILKGILPAKILYSSGGQISGFETEFAFTEIIDLEMASVDSALSSFFNVSDISYSLSNTNGETMLDTDIKIKGGIRAFEKLSCPLVSDIYSPDYNYSVKRNIVKLESFFTLGETQLTLKESLSLPQDEGSISRVHYMSVYPSCKKLSFENSSLKIFGNASTCIIYSDSEGSLNSIKKDIPFETELPCGADYNASDFDVCVSAMNYSYVLSSSNDVQTRTVLKISADQIMLSPVSVVSDFTEDKSSPIDKSNQPSIIVCYPQDGSTLWDYALKYSTTSEEIALVNGIEPESSLCPGKPLIIPKRHI